MGAVEFQCSYLGETVDKAFQTAVDDAYYWYGHSGYTGTICEKPGYIVLDLGKKLSFYEAEDLANELNQSWQSLTPRLLEIISDKNKAEKFAAIANSKWEEAVAIELDTGEWFFCGMASE